MRISVLTAVACLAVVSTTAGGAYPEKPIRLVLPNPAGGSVDYASRALAKKLSESFGQQIVVDNRPAAGGIIGAEAVARAVPDGYTMLMGGTGTLAFSPHLKKRLGYDPVRDFAPVTVVASFPSVIVVHPSLPANSAKELVALAKARPGQINYASGGYGTSSHLSVELFKTLAGINLVHVPYNGAALAIGEVMAGYVQLIVTGISTVLPAIKSNRLRAIGVTGRTRATPLPDVPTVSESGVPGYEVSSWIGVLVPAHTPQAIVGRLNAEIIKSLHTAEIRDGFAARGLDPAGNTAEQFGIYIKEELAKWGKVIKASGIRAD